MRIRTFVALAAVTVVVAGAAVWAVSQRGSGVADIAPQAQIYPELRGKLNDVTELRVHSTSEGTVTIRRGEDGWRMEEKSGYPVRFERVRSTLLELSSMETIEPKTSRPEFWADLGVEPLDDEKARGIQVTALAGDEVIADLVIGNARPPAQGGVFVRKADEERSWLVTGSFQPERRPLQWLDRNVVNVDNRRIWRAEVRHPDGNVAAIERVTPGDEAPTLVSEVPDGMVSKSPYEMNGLAGVPDFLIFEDVLPADQRPEGESIISEFTTMDGLVLRFDGVRADRRTWVTLEASAGPRYDGLEAFIETYRDGDDALARVAGQLRSEEEVAEEIEAINARVSGWVYRLTEYKSGKVALRSDDLVETPRPGGDDDGVMSLPDLEEIEIDPPPAGGG